MSTFGNDHLSYLVSIWILSVSSFSNLFHAVKWQSQADEEQKSDDQRRHHEEKNGETRVLTVGALRRQFVSIQLLPVLVQREEGRTRRKEPVNFARQDASEHPHGAQAVRATVLPPLCASAWYVSFVCRCSMEKDLGHVWDRSFEAGAWFFSVFIFTSDFTKVWRVTNPLPYMALFRGWLKCNCTVHIVDTSVHSVYILSAPPHHRKYLIYSKAFGIKLFSTQTKQVLLFFFLLNCILFKWNWTAYKIHMTR